MVDLPPLRLPFFRSWLRFSPAATWWIAGRETHLHALRVRHGLHVVGHRDLEERRTLRVPGQLAEDRADRGHRGLIAGPDGSARPVLTSR